MSLRQQIATSVISATKYRELMSTMRANRPNDDLEIVRRAYEFPLSTMKDKRALPASLTLFTPWKLPWFWPR